jgi:hypothetical protein
MSGREVTKEVSGRDPDIFIGETLGRETDAVDFRLLRQNGQAETLKI